MRLNEQGSLFFPAILLTMLISFSILIYIYNQKNALVEISTNYHEYLCLKYIDRKTKSFVEKIEKTNQILKYGSFLEYVTWIPLPQAKTAKAALTLAKRALILKQTELFISYQKNIHQLKTKKCPIPYCDGKLLPIPYEYNLLTLRRNKDKTVIRKRDTWQCKYYKYSKLSKQKKRYQARYSLEEDKVRSFYQEKGFLF